jgi:YD repeat-containing protein
MKRVVSVCAVAVLAFAPAGLLADDADVTCPSNATMELAYNVIRSAPEQRLKSADGTLTVYRFQELGKARYQISCTITGAHAQPVSRGLYQYEGTPAALPGTDPAIARFVSTVDGERTETVYDGNGLRTSIATSSGVTRFAYDDAGRVLRKQTARETDEYTYEPVRGKITSVKRITANEHFSATYQYDKDGNLLHAVADGHDIHLTYADGEHISDFDDNGTKISFKYNDKFKPIEIAIAGVGSISVTYEANGVDVKKADGVAVDGSEGGGRKVALLVTSAFQALLDVIRPAGAGTNF